MRIAKLLLAFSLLFIAGRSLSQSPSIMWRFPTHDESFGDGAIGDVDGDGKLEIAFSCYWGDSNIYVVNAEDGSLLWKQNMQGCNDAAPILYDVNNDGRPEVILASSCNLVITCFNGPDGKIIWQTPYGGTDSPPSIADIDGDGKPEIITGDFEGYLNCFTADSGKLKWRVPIDTGSAIEGSIALVDVNNDKHPDMIAVTWPNYHPDSAAIYAFDGVTHKLLWKNYTPANNIYHGAAFADVTEDGVPDIAVSSYDGNVYLLKGSDGSIEWTYPTTGFAYIGDPVTIGDINKDGHLDLVYSNGNGELDALDRFGHFMWSFMMTGPSESAFCGAALADVNNDDTLDVVFATTAGKLYALNGSRGNLLWEYNLRADDGDSDYEFQNSPVISSFKQDDTVDVFVAGGYTYYPNLVKDFGKAYALKIGKSSGTDWLMFQHDYMRSNCVCNPEPAAVSEVSNSTVSVKDYPNPFAQHITFNISLAKPEYVSVVMYNMQGQVIKVFAENTLKTGSYEFSWNGENEGGSKVAEGVYYCRITAGNYTTVKKVVLTR